MGKAPSFQFYPKDWLTDPDVVCMSMAQKGAYITLICYCWKEDKLPNNPDYIRKLLGNVPKWKTLWNGIKVSSLKSYTSKEGYTFWNTRSLTYPV